jgi:hypothetical protein
MSADSAQVVSDEAPSAPAMDMPALDELPAPTLEAIAQRYPLLRNTF